MTIPLNLFQASIILLSLYFIIDRLKKYFSKERSQSLFKLTATIGIWFGVLVFGAIPSLARKVSLFLGLGENLNTLIFLGFIIVFMILFKFVGIFENIEKNITEIVRKEALKGLFENTTINKQKTKK